MERKYTLVWCPVEKAKRENIPFALLEGSGGKLIYKLPSTLTFGHLELNGIDITGYFKPLDDDAEYICRPWMVEDTPAPILPPPPVVEEEEDE